MAKIIGWIALILFLGSILAIVLNTCTSTVKVVKQEFSPEALLKKYEWFKDASAQLDAKLANLKDYKQRYANIKQSYGADSSIRAKWSRDDREQWNTWQSEESGVKASYNDLAAQYNAAMAKFNYRFCNKGTLPQGAEEPLPREYRSYI